MQSAHWTVVVSVAGFVLSVFALLHNIRSQSNSVKLELYKRQADLIVKLARIADKLFTIADSLDKYPDSGRVDRHTEGLEKNKQAQDELMDLKIEAAIILSESVLSRLEMYERTLREYRSHVMNFDKSVESIGGQKSASIVLDRRQDASEALEQFMSEARTSLGTEVLSEGLVKMLGISEREQRIKSSEADPTGGWH